MWRNLNIASLSGKDLPDWDLIEDSFLYKTFQSKDDCTEFRCAICYKNTTVNRVARVKSISSLNFIGISGYSKSREMGLSVQAG
jgi:hypothetical protein